MLGASFFSGYWVEDSVDAVELERVRRLVKKCGRKVDHGMSEYVDIVNIYVLRFGQIILVRGCVTVYGGGNIV